MVNVWKKLKKENDKMMENPEDSSYENNSSREEEDTWMEDIILTDLVRNKMMALETWYLTSYLNPITAGPIYANEPFGGEGG